MESREDRTQRISVRVPTDLLEDYDEVLDERGSNRSKDLRQHMRSVVNTPERSGRQTPTDDEVLAQGYRALKQAAGGRSIPVREACAVVARATNIPKESVGRRVIKRLENRGCLSRGGDPLHDPYLIVYE